MEKIQFIKVDAPQLAVYLNEMFVFVLSAQGSACPGALI